MKSNTPGLGVHELGITQQVVEIAEGRAEGRPVRRVVLEIGKLTAVLPDAVRFCFDVCTRGTALDGAVLEIVETPGLGRCRACGKDVPMDRPFGVCACGNSDLEWVAGEELRVREIEVR